MIYHDKIKNELKTNPVGGVCPIKQTVSEKGSTVIIDRAKCYGGDPRDFDRIEIEIQTSNRWLDINFDRIRKNRIYQASAAIDKAQAKLLLETLAELVEKMED